MRQHTLLLRKGKMKVLIVSHNPITTYHNMGKTMQALFRSFLKEELCQLYVYPTIPDIDYCDAYYRITDKDVLRSYFAGFHVRGQEIDKSQISGDNQMFETAGDERKYRVTQPTKRMMRDVMWKCTHWYTQELKDWVKRQAPTCIFVAPGDAAFLYDVTLSIAKDFDLPIVTYICDDVYFVKKPRLGMRRLRYHLLRRKTEGLMKQTAQVVAICPELEKPFAERFGVQSSVIMTGGDSVERSENARGEPTSITYMGNIVCNRFLSLAEIGNELDRLNCEFGTHYELKIYTGEKDEQILSTFDGIESVKLCGFLTGEAYKRVFSSADLLLHVEAFDAESIDLVKHSVSTKIAELLASGIPVVAYGPAEVASMQHLIRNGCAFSAVSREQLRDTLKEAFTDEPKRRQIIASALRTANDYHDIEKNGNKLRSVIESCAEGYEPRERNSSVYEVEL